MKWARVVVVGCVLVCSWAAAMGQELPKARPETVGLSPERLGRISTLFQAEVDKGAIPGAVVLVARGGTLAYFEAFGYQNREKKIAMRPDSIFRIASMTKPITSVAVMMLAEEGKIDLLAHVDRYLPEFKEVKVGVQRVDPGTGAPVLKLEDPVRPILVQDLLRHTSGLVYGRFGTTLVHQAYDRANLFDPSQTLAEFVAKLSKLPLAHQPGTVWEYSMSIDVLGRIVEVAAGVPFDEFVEQRITKPLLMRDTGFYLTAAQVPRMAEMQADSASGLPSGGPSLVDLAQQKPKWISGGGGLWSTALDYGRFCQMLSNGGELDGTRLLSAKTIAVMISDQLPPGVPRAGIEDLAPTEEMGQTFGLGFAVRTHAGRNPVSGSVGDYFWAGIYGTYFWVDPQEKLYGVLMVQMPFAQAGYYRRALREIVYGALVH
jgi:CubicO group peptidase (beta-lactamase class C family)